MTSSYLKAFQRLHVSRSYGIAPHKPVLLLSILDAIEKGNITENRIYITPELVSLFKYNWSLLVDNERFNPNFALPFYHLKTEKFWHLKTLFGSEIELTSSNSIKSLSYLKSVLDHAYLDDHLFIDLANPQYRAEYVRVLLDWFPSTKNNYLLKKPEYATYLLHFEKQILGEEKISYPNQVVQNDEEEIFVRGGVFKKVVPRTYNYTCCISGMRVSSVSSIQMIDACHIVPFSDSHNDSISNGISLCPNLHRAFDRGLISIDENYKVRVSKTFTESAESEYSIRRYNDRKIFLPTEMKYYPGTDNLRWHYENRFIK